MSPNRSLGCSLFRVNIFAAATAIGPISVASVPKPGKKRYAIRPTVETFYMDDAEVINEQYAVFIKDAGHRAPFHWISAKLPGSREKQPVAHVSWDDVVNYCSWQGEILPVESEWEKAYWSGLECEMYP